MFNFWIHNEANLYFKKIYVFVNVTEKSMKTKYWLYIGISLVFGRLGKAFCKKIKNEFTPYTPSLRMTCFQSPPWSYILDAVWKTRRQIATRRPRGSAKFRHLTVTEICFCYFYDHFFAFQTCLKKKYISAASHLRSRGQIYSHLHRTPSNRPRKSLPFLERCRQQSACLFTAYYYRITFAYIYIYTYTSYYRTIRLLFIVRPTEIALSSTYLLNRLNDSPSRFSFHFLFKTAPCTVLVDINIRDAASGL